jgi:serine/threonine-protein kinase
MTSAPLIGTQLGVYQIEALLGSGGMATVYRGLDLQLQRPVAIKVLAPTLAGDPDYVRRFKREAQLIASLQHPNVARIYAFGEQHGAPYMVQEFLPGLTLEQRLRDLATTNALLPQETVLTILEQVAAALDAAHRLSVIHRDVKPANVIANARGEYVLTDFGIARSATDTHYTQAGVVMGTPAYLAPEQAISSAALTPAVDSYALGVLLFQLATGKLPFTADTPTAVVLKHLYDTPPLVTQLRPELPPALDAVLQRALEKEPELRYQSVLELVAAAKLAWLTIPQPVASQLQPTAAWTPPNLLAPAAAHVQTMPQVVVQPGIPAPATAILRQPMLKFLLPSLALVVGLLFVFWLILRGEARSSDDQTLAPTSRVALATIAPTTPPTAAPVAAPIVNPAPTEVPTSLPTVAPTVVPTAVATDPLLALGALITQGLSDGSAGDDAPEYLQRYGELAAAIGSDDDKIANEQIRELSRKIAERDRERKLDAAFAEQAAALLMAIAEQHGLKRPTGQ